MPSVVDMGLGGVLNGQQSNFLNDPGVLLGMLSLRERQKARKSDEAYRQERAEVSDRQFERSAGQRDQQIGIQQAAGQRAQASFDRGVKQEDAAGSYFTTLGDEMGLFEQEDPQTGARMGVPEIRQRFEQMSPDDQRRALSFHMEELAQQSEQRKAVEAQMQTQQLLGGFQKQLMGAAETGDLDETMAQMFAERMQGAVTGASGEKPFQVMEDFQAVRQRSMAQRVESERRLGVATGVQEQLMLSTANNPQLNAQAAMLLDGYTSGGLTDDQFFDGLNTIQKTQAAAQKATTGDMTGLLTQVYKYPPEQAALINAALSSGALDFSRLEQVPGPGSVSEADKMMLGVLGDREKVAADVAKDMKATPGDPEYSAYEQAQRLFGQEFERTTGKKIPRAEPSEAGVKVPDMSPGEVRAFSKKNGQRIFKELKKSLGRDPSADELKAEMMRQASGGS